MIYVGSCIIICCFDSFAAYMICKQDFKYIGVIKGLKMGFLDGNVTFPESCTVTASPVSCSCAYFTCFCFELGFGVNMKVVDNCVSFLMALVWLQNHSQNLSYGQNTTHRSQ